MVGLVGGKCAQFYSLLKTDTFLAIRILKSDSFLTEHMTFT